MLAPEDLDAGRDEESEELISKDRVFFDVGERDRGLVVVLIEILDLLEHEPRSLEDHGEFVILGLASFQHHVEPQSFALGGFSHLDFEMVLDPLLASKKEEGKDGRLVGPHGLNDYLIVLRDIEVGRLSVGDEELLDGAFIHPPHFPWLQEIDGALFDSDLVQDAGVITLSEVGLECSERVVFSLETFECGVLAPARR